MTTPQAMLSALRAELKARKLNGFIIPLTDEHMSEYVGDYAQRLRCITGFTGSAGNAVVLDHAAAIFVDGRYTIQVANEVDDTLIERHHFEAYPLLRWTGDHMEPGQRIGYDAELATVAWVKDARETLAAAGVELVAVETNPIDAVWTDRPREPLSPLMAHPVEYTGQTSTDKRRDVSQVLRQSHADAAIVSMLDSVAWAFNIRADDVKNTPVPHAYAILYDGGSAELFVHPDKVTDEVRRHLGNGVSVRSRDEFYQVLEALGTEGKSVLVDPSSNNSAIIGTLEAAGATLVEGKDPCILMKARKNKVEQEGSRQSHIRDGVAVTEFLHWLSLEAPDEELDELGAAAKLWEFRQKRDLLKGASFDTISASGPNGALCHYSVDEDSNRQIKLGDLYLVDSGGQYDDGTTDITRTVAIGHPTNEMKLNFTRVLKGHIALSTTRFPVGTTGMALDSIARHPLWQAGLDYDHGTGHGVGSYLAVHEGPQRIAKAGSDVPLEAGMILSNEPGYYKAGEYGIRIENLVLVKASGQAGERPMLEFENLTWAPIDRTLIDPSLLTDVEMGWLNTYHRTVFEKIGALVAKETRAWLAAATAPITR